MLEPLIPPTPSQAFLDTSFAPSILFTFSSPSVDYEPPSPALPAFCLPSGARIRAQVVPPPRFACFVLTTKDGERLYGHCLTTYELLPGETKVRWTSPTPTGIALDGAAPDHNMVTSVEGLLLASAKSGGCCYAPRCLCILSRAHHPLAFKASLTALHQMAARSASVSWPPLTLPMEACLTHLVLNVPRPVPGGPAVRFGLGNASPALHVSCAPPTQLPRTDYSALELLARVRPQMLMRLFHCTLLEMQVVLVCDDDEQRVAACELLLLLLHPLEWAHVYVPSLPDELLGLTANPFPCILGLRTGQASQLPAPLPESMAVLTLLDDATAASQGVDATRLQMPARALPDLPSREANHLLAALLAARSSAATEQSESTLGSQPPAAGARGAADAYAAGPSLAPADADLPPPVLSIEALIASTAWEPEEPIVPLDAASALLPAALEASCRGAFLRFFVSLLRDLHRFLPDDGAVTFPPPPSDATSADLFDESVERFVSAQPALSQPFLREFVGTQLFLSFVQPPEAGPGSGAGGAAQGGRGGRCFQLVRDAFLQRELAHAAERERAHGKQPLPLSAELLVVPTRGAAPAQAMPSQQQQQQQQQAQQVFEVPPPALADVAALLPGGYRYPDGLPTSLPPDRMAAHQPAPPFEGEPPPTPRVSPAVRAAWAEALAELERRDESRQGAHAIGIAGAGAMIGGAAAAMLCSVQ